MSLLMSQKLLMFKRGVDNLSLTAQEKSLMGASSSARDASNVVSTSCH